MLAELTAQLALDKEQLDPAELIRYLRARNISVICDRSGCILDNNVPHATKPQEQLTLW